mmetsp:Transcript_29197/g.74201  ORF Transcript_29197/g.74201 Transcript_29197/m.74201 type:complete len:229 (-) Transcript_29197:1436-2122(-)
MTSCSKESSKTMHLPSVHPRGASAAKRMRQPCSAVFGIRMPMWQVRRELLGPQCGRSREPGVSTLKITSPPPHSARPVASRQWVCRIEIVSGKYSAYSRFNVQLANRGTSRQLPDFAKPPSWRAPGRPPTSLGPGVLSESSQSLRLMSRVMYSSYSRLMVGKCSSSCRHISKSWGSCQADAFSVGTKCGGRCQTLYQMPLRTACAASSWTSSYQLEGSLRSRAPMRLM